MTYKVSNGTLSLYSLIHCYRATTKSYASKPSYVTPLACSLNKRKQSLMRHTLYNVIAEYIAECVYFYCSVKVSKQVKNLLKRRYSSKQSQSAVLSLQIKVFSTRADHSWDD